MAPSSRPATSSVKPSSATFSPLSRSSSPARRARSSFNPESSRTSVSSRRTAAGRRASTFSSVSNAAVNRGMADVATVLFGRFLKFDPTDPKWPDRDRFVLSAGHGSMLLYALLHLTGYTDVTIEDIKRFRQLGSPCAGHPEYGHGAGVETTTGPLGQGIATAVGMALAE